jgi:hypothetical protein
MEQQAEERDNLASAYLIVSPRPPHLGQLVGEAFGIGLRLLPHFSQAGHFIGYSLWIERHNVNSSRAACVQRLFTRVA